MATSLASQLARLQQRPGTDKKLAHSFLFSDSDAKGFSRDQIYELAMSGLETLLRIDNRLHPFLANIFSKAHVRRERAMLTSAEAEESNKHMEALLSLLAPHLFLTAAQQVIEYLVRVWEIHSYNVGDVLETFLPYHDHSLFARMVLLLDLRDTGFEALSKNQMTGAPLLGSQLRVLCGESRKALRAVCNCATKAVKYSVANHAAFALYTGVCSSLAIHPDGEALFRTIIPTLNDFISWSSASSNVVDNNNASGFVESVRPNAAAATAGGASSSISLVVRGESLSAALVVLCAWSQETQFGARVLSALLKPFLRALLHSTFPVPIRDAIIVLGVLFRSQGAAVQDASFTPVLRQLIDLPWRDWAGLIPQQQVASSRPSSTAELFSSLLRYVCVSHLVPSENPESLPADVRQFLLTASEVLPLTQEDVSLLLGTVARHRPLHAAFCGGSSDIAKVLPAVRRRIPLALDRAIVELMRPAAASTTTTNASKSAAAASAAAVTEFIERFFQITDAAESTGGENATGALTATAYKRIDISSVGGNKKKTSGGSESTITTRVPLSVCLMHYISEVRRIALGELTKLSPTDVAHCIRNTKNLSSVALVDVLLYVVRFDSDLVVVNAALNILKSWVAAVAKKHDDNEETSSTAANDAAAAQSFLAVASEAVYECAVGLTKLPQTPAAGGQQQPLVATFESAIALLTFVTNSTSTTAASALAKYHILLIAQSTATSLDAYISGTFGPIALTAVLAASSIPKKDVPSDSSVSTVLLKSPALRDAVLTVASTPGRRHFRTVFQRVLQEAQRPRGEAASTEQAAEINILVASASAVGLEGTSAFAAQADEILDALVAWVDPNGKSSFTAVVRSVAQEELAKQLAERGPGATGRGAKAAADGAVEGAVSSHVVSKQVVAALLGAMDSILPAVEKHTATASQINAGVAIVKTVRVLTTNSTVVAPSTVVPTSAFFAAPKTISRVLLRCLETPSPFATKDWHSEIGKLLITPAASSSFNRAALEVDGQVVILLLLVPALPSADEDNKDMTMYVQQLQHHVTEAMTSKKKTVSNIPVAAIVQSVIAANLLSATGFSAVIEAIALGRPGAESTRAAAPLPADAARIVAGWVAAGAAAQFQLPLLNIFFPLPSAGNVQSGGQREERRRGNHVLLLSEMLPLINDALVKSQEALSRSKIASLSSTEIEVVEYLLRGIYSLENNNSKNGDEVTETETFLTCFLSAYPSILIAESGKDYAPVYREALSAMARIFAPASSTAGAKSTTVIFTAGKSAAPNKGKQTAVAAAPNSGNAASQRLHGLLVALWSRHGADVAQYAACTASGMESLLLPLMRRATSSAGQQQLDVAFVIEALEAKFSPNATTWTTLEAVAASSPQLQAGEALAFVKSQSALLVNSTTVAATDSDISSRLTALRAASLLLGSAVALAHNTDDDDDDDDVTPAHHAATFATAVLDAVPLSCLGTLVISAAATSASSLTAARSAVVAFATTLTKCVVEHNSEADLFTALRHSATKELLALMTTVLGHGDSEDALATTSDAVATVEVTKGAAGMVNFVGKLLTAIAPLLNESESTTTGSSSSSSSTSLLHVVILALMLRLEPLSGTEVLQFRTVVECCRDIITTFDVDTQMMCIAGVMRTLMYPHNPLKRSIESEVAGGDNKSHGDDNEDEASAAHGGIVKKLLKANKIINRQELILELVVSTLKSDEFLAPFIAQQQRGGGSNRHQLKKKKSSQEEEAAAAAAAGEEDEGKEAEAHSSHDTCMQLLLTSLGLFAHYHTLNESTENVIDNTTTSDEEEGAVISEEKSFVMMLELLSGNALGCILAGINEPTFVECLKRLLNDSRVALQVKGLEMLVDRLHQAVPTIEDTLTDSEAEQRRRDLRDPRKKLTNYDLLLLKARPLATKRTMALFPLMHHLLSGSLRTVVKSSATAAPHRQLVLLAQLGITAMEELARTVGSGGSLHSEATLAQSERSLVVSEAQVFKLFGSKAKAAEVKTFLSLLLTQLGPLQQRITALSSADASSAAAKKSTSATAIELAALFASAVTAVATIVQTLGAAFVASFSNEIMQVSSSALSFCVSTMPGELARAPIGSLVRVACFNTVLRVFSATWLMCAPYLPQILAASCHKTSVSDSETSASSAELLRTIKALIEPRVMLECCCTALSGSSSSAPTIKATTHNFTVLFECIESLVQSLTKRDIAAMPVLVADIPEVSRNMWIAALQSLASMPQLPTADEANAVSDAFLAMIVKFKSDDCKRHITTLLSWAFEELTGGAAATAAKKSEKKGSKKAGDDDDNVSSAPTVSNSKQGLHRMILFLGLYNRVVDKLQSLSEFSFAAVSGALVPTFVQSLRRSSDAQDDDDEDDVRGRKRSAGLDALSTLLLESALDAVRRMSDAQVPAPDTPVAAITTPYFAEAKVFNALMPPFLQQLGNVRVLTDESRTYDHRIVHTVIPAFRSFFKALASPKLWSSAQAELLKHLRSPKHQVRRAVLRAFRSIYTDGGDEMAATIMSEMLPAVVEATEDTHSDVVEEARLLCNDLSTISGRDVLHAMS